MTLFDFQDLIINLPVLRQSFTTKRSNWQKFEQQHLWYSKINDEIFRAESVLKISREDIFKTENLQHRILKTIYWGYPRGMRGNHFSGIIEKIDKLASIIKILKANTNHDANSFETLKNEFQKISGLGLSTYSKILYFSGIQFNNNSSLILDKRLIDVFNNNSFSEFENLPSLSGYNAESYYLDYLKIFSQLSGQLNTNGENLEQFLFIFGNNLK